MRSRTWAHELILTAGVFVCASALADAQGTRHAGRSESETGLTLSAEAFCNPPKRTSSVRLRWGLSPAARSATRLTTLATAKQTLETTIYVDGFEKGLYVSLAVPSGSERVPVAATTPATARGAQLRQAPPRAFQIRLIESGAAGTTTAADGAEFSAVVEDVEPGLNYTWRLTIEGPSGTLVSAPVEVQAVTCPIDVVEPVRPPATKVPPKSPPKRRR
jgi:hypothetical protein